MNKRRFAWGLGTALALAGALGADRTAAQTPVPTAPPVAPAGIHQVDPFIGSIGAADELLVWSEDRGSGHELFAKRVRVNGIPVPSAESGDWPFTGATGSGADAGKKGDQRSPYIASSVAVWSEKAPGAADYDIYAQRVFPNGRTRGVPTMVAGGPGNQLDPSLIATASGYLLVFGDDSADEGDVLALRLTQALTVRGTAFGVAKGAGVSSDPIITLDLLDPRTDYLVLFTHVAEAATQKDIFGARMTESGLPRGTLFPVVNDPAVDEYAPFLLATASADFERDAYNLLLFNRDDATTGPDVVLQRLRSNGAGVGPERIVGGGTGAQRASAATVLSDGQWLVVWQDDASGNADVVGTKVRVNGIPLPPVRVLVTE